jgi:tetratricopeptide (TPR) repeat protein
VLGVADQFKEAAEFIIENRNLVPGPVAELAFKIIHPGEVAASEAAFAEGEDEPSVRRIRERLKDEPRNAILWVELSRLYTAVAKRARALECMRVAVALAPDSRFVVRAAARLFLHEGESEAALRVIRGASGVRRDPWLLAAEIATTSALKAPSLLAKVGRGRNEDSALSQFERTELASALGTLEVENGRIRRARQLFRQALIAPNENSVAQVEWANREIGGLDVAGRFPEVPCLHEARAQVSLASGNWKLAISYGREWLRDQFFSRHPAVFTSYVSSLVENYQDSIEILRGSLRVNPGDSMLLNNLAFSLASDDKVPEAIQILRVADYRDAGGASGVTLAATHGLVCYRVGEAERGRSLYRLAMERAVAFGAQKYKVMAELYMAREELLARTEVAREAASGAIDHATKTKDCEVGVLAAQVRRLYDKVGRELGWSALAAPG